MQCFLCMTYVILYCSALPAKDKPIDTQHEERSLFRDVIESLRIHAQLPEDLVQNDGNNLAQNYERYGLDSEPPHLPSDAEFIPRRNDRIEMPTLKYRYPKSLTDKNDSKVILTTDYPKEEIVVYIDTTKESKASTAKPKKPQKRRPPVKKQNEEEVVEEETEVPEAQVTSAPPAPVTNTLAGQSQIGNRESQIVLKPTVIVNFRGSVSTKESDIKLNGRKNEDNGTIADPPQNVFNIRQEVKLERTFSGMGSRNGVKGEKRVKQEVKSEGKVFSKVEESAMMCETDTRNNDPEERSGRKFGNIFQIMFTV